MSLVARFPAGSVAIILLGTCAPLPAQAPLAAAMPVAEAAAPAPVPGRFGLTGSLTQGGIAIGAAPRGTTLLMFGDVPVPIAPDRRFLIAFDRDAPMGAQLTATLENGSRVEEALTIAPRAWDIQRLATVAKVPMGQPAYDRLRPPEVAQINAARRMQTDAQGWRQPFLWPVTGRISTLFGSQRIYKNGEAGSYHSGIDIARPAGTPVLAPADGVVILATAAPFTLEGNMVMVDHGMGLNSALMHLSRIDVTVGQHVRRGQPIGLVGKTGARVTGPHLHWGLKWRESRIDPLLLAGPMPVADDR
ncbi:MAG: M23 family metallopeptidase [Pseudomonadota bacterium]